MKPIGEMNKGELMEAIAAVSLRVLGFIFIVSALVYFDRWAAYFIPAMKRGDRISVGTRVDGDQVLLHLLLALLLFNKAGGLARLLCRGLEAQLTGPAESLK